MPRVERPADPAWLGDELAYVSLVVQDRVMLRARTAAFPAVLTAVVACTSAVEPAKPSEPEPSGRPAESPAKPIPDPTTPSDTTPAPTPPVDATQQWVCKQDADCTQTCALGAVSSAWIKAHPEADECDDGCGWKYGKQACRDGECVTLSENGDIDASCTKILYPRKR